MMIDKIGELRKYFEELLEKALKIDSNEECDIRNKFDLEINYLIDQIKLFKKYEKIKKEYDKLKS